MGGVLEKGLERALREGFLDLETVKRLPGYPGDERLKEGPCAVIECAQEIPCNPCESACPFGAIEVGEPITRLPKLHPEKCKGCGICVASCPGLAIFVVDMTFSENEAAVSLPWEYLPVPQAGDRVNALSRSGEVLGNARVVDVKSPKSYDHTAVVTVAVPKGLAGEVRGLRL